MIRVKPGLAGWSAALALALPAHAGLYVEQTMTRTGQQESTHMLIRAWTDGGRARVEYVDSDDKVLPEGSYLLTTDGGETVYLIRPDERTYSVWDLDQIFNMASTFQQQSGGMFKMDFRDPHSEKLLEEPGGTLLGRETVHRSWRTGFTMDLKIAFMDRSNRVESVTDVWVTDDVRDPALDIWFGARPPTTGDPELDEILTTGLANLDGLVLRLEQETTTTDQKGNRSVGMMVMEVTELREETPSAALFEMPSGYTEVPLLPAGMHAEASGDDDGGPMKALGGLFGRKKNKTRDN